MAYKGPLGHWTIESTGNDAPSYVFSPVTGFSAVQGSAVGDIDLSWTNPVHSDFKEVVIRRKVGTFPTSPTDGDPVYTGTGTSHTDSGLPTGITYLYSAFAFDIWNISSNAAQSSASPLPPDTTAPPPITNFVATPGPGQITLTWDNPADPDFEGTLIRRKENSYPVDENDGDLVYQGGAETVLDSGLDHLKTYYYSGFSYDNPIQGPPPNYAAPAQVSASPNISTPTTPRLDSLLIIEALTEIIGESDSAIAGYRATRLRTVAGAGATSFAVESVLDWAENGYVGIDGIKYKYTSRTDDTLTGITFMKNGVETAGAAVAHRLHSVVVDASEIWSAQDLVYRSLNVETSEGPYLTVIGRNLGVGRLAGLEGDDQYREIIKASAYNPKGTLYGIETALTGLLGTGNFSVSEDLLQHPHKVFVNLGSSAILSNVKEGKGYLTTEHVSVAGEGALNLDEIALPANTELVGGVKLSPINNLFSFKAQKPSVITYPYYPGHAGGIGWGYVGSESEATAVLVLSGYTKFENTAPTGTVLYQMDIPKGGRITPDSYVEISCLLLIPSAAVVGQYDYSQMHFGIEDGSKNLRVGLGNTPMGFVCFNANGTGNELGTKAAAPTDTWHELTIKKFGQKRMELIINGNLISSVDYSAFTQVSSNRQITFGLEPTSTGMVFHTKQLGLEIEDPTDYWVINGNGSVLGANPDRLTKGAGDPGFVSGDVGKYLAVTESAITNPGGGSNNGKWKIHSYIDASNVELRGDTLSDCFVQTVLPTRITLSERVLVFPDDLGKDIVIEGAGSNAGSYTISILRDPDSPADDLAFWNTPIKKKTNICEVTSASFTNETGLDVHLEPTFATESPLPFKMSDGGNILGTSPNQLATLRSPMWTTDLLMKLTITNVLSGQVLENSQIQNNMISASPLLFDYYPLYLANPIGLVEAFMDVLTAAGVHAVFTF